MSASTIGIRSEWKCIVCREKACVHQVATAADPVLDVPQGWRVVNGRTYCPEHIPSRIQIAALLSE